MTAGLSFYGWVALVSSLALRMSGYVFLRWIPGHHLPPMVLAAALLYFTSLILDRQGSVSHDTPTKSRKTWLSWIHGVPDSRFGLFRWVPVVVNTAIVIMVLDLTFFARIFHPSHDLVFTRVGCVSHDTARILVRDPRVMGDSLTLSYKPQSLRAPTDPAPWLDVVSEVIGVETDYTAVFDITGLEPGQRYQYSVSSRSLQGHFTTATRDRLEPFTFLHSSCVIPNFPYRPFRHHLEVPGLKHLSNRLPELRAKFMLFLGDFIYIDVPYRFGIDKETYRREYRQVYGSPDWNHATQLDQYELPWLHVLDDHEIANDWDKNETGIYSAAADPWHHYQVAVNPPPVRPGVSYFSFSQGPASFFLMDTRRYRTPFDGTNGTWDGNRGAKSMLGERQRQDLLEWISVTEAPGVKWKVIVSSIPFTKNWRFGSEDTWGGYLGERQVLLEAMWEASAAQGIGIVVLSGDRHEFAATAFPPPNSGPDANRWPAAATVHEFSASPLSMFYLPIRTYRQEDDEDVCLKYLPDGNSKFGALKFTSSPTSEQSVLDYRLFIDGEEAWSYTVTTPPARSVKSPSPVSVFSWLRVRSKPHLIAG